MGLKDFKLKWAHGIRRGEPVFVSNEKILIPSNFSMKTCDLSGNRLRHHFETKFKIGCVCSLPELGLIAVSERKVNGAIYILSYSKMSKISVLEQADNESYSALQFIGLELLLSFQIKKSYEIDLWKWHSGERVFFLTIPFLLSEVPGVSIFFNPLLWHQCLLQNKTRLMLLEVKYFEDKYTLHISNYNFFIDKEDKLNLSISNECSKKRNFQTDVINPLMKPLTVQNVCWLPENNILAATSNGILKITFKNSSVHKVAENKTGVSAMALTKSGLFVGYKTGFIDVVNILGNHWHVLETIKIGQPISQFLQSPDYSYLIVTTLKGSIFYNEMCKNESAFKFLHRSEFGGEVGICFIGPLAKVCVAARKNGLIDIIQSFDGSILSSFELNEEIVSLTASPLCSCFVIGTNSGFVYFIDATDFLKLRVVNCEKPYDIPVDHLKFDNFGRYLFASAHSEPIKIWNGLPSSGFASLGLKKITFQVKDFIAFSRAEDDETNLLILYESGSGSEKETGNMLIRLKFPIDFGTDPKKYQIDVFGFLNGDILNFQKRKLDNLSCKMNLHWSLGAVFYCPSVNKVRKYNLWSDFSNVKYDDILTIRNVNFMRISPCQNWIAITDLYGCTYLYSSKDIELCATSEKYYLSDSICRSFIEFPLSSNYLICGRENGVTLCYEWTESSISLQNVPEWIVYCCSKSEKENECLHSSDEESRLDITPHYADSNYKKPLHPNETYEEFKIWMRILNFKLSILSDDCDSNSESNSKAFSFNEHLLEKTSSHNRKKLIVIAPEDCLKDGKVIKKSGGQGIIKTLSSIGSDFVTQNYSRENIDVDMNTVNKLSFYYDKKVTSKLLPNLSFSKTVKMKTKEERFATIISVFNHICDLKKGFNEEFDNLSRMKPDINNRLDEAYFEARRLTHTLPSKSERDFYSATVNANEMGRLFESVESKDDIKSKQNPQKSIKDDIKETKQYIESHVKSARDLQEDYDSNFHTLFLKKRYTDHTIYRFEMKIYCNILFTEEEDKYSKWKVELEKEIKFIEGFRNNVDEISKEISDIQKNIKDLYSTLQKTERNISGKIDAKCNKINISDELFTFLKSHPTQQLDEKSENPFWRCSPTINEDDITSISKDILFQNVLLNENHITVWNKICNKQIRVLKIGIILRNLLTQLLTITQVKQSLVDSDSELKTTLDILQNARQSASSLISKCSMVFCSLDKDQLENKDLKLEGDFKIKEQISSENSTPKSDQKIWRNIDREDCRVMHIQRLLEEIENVFGRLNKLNSELISKSSDVQSTHLDLMKGLKITIDESKENILKTKNIADGILEESKTNIFKSLKPRIFNDISFSGKSKECK